VPPHHATTARLVRPRLIATDLDGTLLRDDKSVSARTVAALAAAERAGIEVFFVTGRPARWMGVVSDHVHGHGLAICANGAAVVDLHHGRRIVEVRELPRADALHVVDALRTAAPGVSFAVERSGGIHYEPDYPPFHLDPGAVVAPVEKLLAETRGAHEPGTQENPFVDQPVLKLLAHHPALHPDAFLALGRSTAGTHAQFTRSSPTALLEISGPGVSKASTLARCCAERGIAPQDVLAFGDMPNDLEMLAWAGTSYAMANAHPDVLAGTPRRTLSNEEDGVAAVIERLLAP
jgi:Cof subfamily protein (haloacid dehalogenase superfamily)